MAGSRPAAELRARERRAGDVLNQVMTADPDGAAQMMLDSGMVAAGTPDDVFEVLDRFGQVGMDQVIIHMQMGGVPHEEIMRSIEILGTEVFPKLR